MPQIPIFLINLDRAPDRLTWMVDQFDRLGLSFERIPAVDGRALSEEEVASLTDLARARFPKRFAEMPVYRPMARTELGNYLSHLTVLRRMVSDGLPAICVLEDDVALDADFGTFIDDAFFAGCGFDILKLESVDKHPKNNGVVVSSYQGRNLPVFPYRNVYGCAAYVVNAKTARYILDYFSVPRLPFDNEVMRFYVHDYLVGHVCPYPARQARDDSIISQERKKLLLTTGSPKDALARGSLHRIWYNLRQAFQKLVRQIRWRTRVIRHFGRYRLEPIERYR